MAKEKHFGIEFRRFREFNNKTQKEAATVLGVERGAVSNWETGSREFGDREWVALQRVLVAAGWRPVPNIPMDGGGESPMRVSSGDLKAMIAEVVQ